MAFIKRSHALVQNPQIGGSAWSSRVASNKSADVDKNIIAKYSPDKWLLSHVSIIASVDTDLADPKDPTSNYLIRPEHSIFVNNNGDSWERQLLTLTYETFLGANNYVEHVQIPELSKGKVIDVALREVSLGKNLQGEPYTTLYADLLVATSRKHEDLCNKIISGEYNAMSMGCLIQYSICSKCGNRAKDETEACDHIRYYKGNTFYDRSGNKRIIAELCGHKSDPKSVTFIDASWVRNPAFPGAVLRNIVSPGIEQPPGSQFQDELMAELSKNVTLDDDHHSIPKNASVLDLMSRPVYAEDGGEAAPPSDEGFPEAPAEAPAEDVPEDAPADETPAEETPADDAPADSGDAPEPAEEKTEVSPEVAKTPFSKIKNEVKDSLMGQIKQELVNQTKEMMGEITDGPARGNGNPSLENSINDSLVKEASEEILNKYSVDLGDVHPKLAAALILMSKTKHFSLSKLAYSRSEMVGILYFLNKKAAASDLPADSLRFIETNSINGMSKKAYLTDFIIDVDRKVSRQEADRVWGWAQIIE